MPEVWWNIHEDEMRRIMQRCTTEDPELVYVEEYANIAERRINTARSLGDRVWDILVDECGAREDGRDEFLHHFPVSEYRFQGTLGFGGKLRTNHQQGRVMFFVDCYSEDFTPFRLSAMKMANARLKELR